MSDTEPNPVEPPGDDGGATDPVRPDGRRVRRDRNADAVIDGFLALFAEGHGFPTAHEVAARSGVSLRSVFRYFEDLDELVTAAVKVQIERFRDHLQFLQPPAELPLGERIDYLVAERLERYARIGQMFSMALARAGRTPQIRDLLDEHRAIIKDELAELFAPELAVLDPDLAAAAVGTVHNTTLFEGYGNLVDRHGMTPEQIGGVYRLTLTALFAHLG